MKKSLFVFSFFMFIVLSRPALFSHCEVPCGIYNDQMRFTMLAEHVQTIKKAMQQIIQLTKDSPQNMNQAVRWIMNKEKHAEEIQHIIGQYFMTQRIKSLDSEDEQARKNYMEKLAHCHQIMVFAMKTKQTIDLNNVEKLKFQVEAFKKIYFEGNE